VILVYPAHAVVAMGVAILTVGGRIGATGFVAVAVRARVLPRRRTRRPGREHRTSAAGEHADRKQQRCPEPKKLLHRDPFIDQ